MAKKVAKKSAPKIKKYSKTTTRPFRFLWISFGIFAFLLTVLTSSYIYTNKQNPSTVLAASNFSICEHSYSGPGNYCGTLFGVHGDRNARYLCGCKTGTKCINAPILLRTDSAKACGGCKYNPRGGDKCPLLDDNGRSFKQGENSDAASGKKPPEKSAINTKEKEEVVATKFVEISIGKPHLTHTCVGTAYTINTTWSISGTNKKVIVWYYRNGSIIGDDLPPSNFSHFPIRSNIASKGDNITVKVQQYEGTVSNSSSFVYQGCTLTPVKILKQL